MTGKTERGEIGNLATVYSFIFFSAHVYGVPTGFQPLPRSYRCAIRGKTVSYSPDSGPVSFTSLSHVLLSIKLHAGIIAPIYRSTAEILND